MALPITDLPYRGYAPTTWDTVTAKRIIDELNTLGNTVANLPTSAGAKVVGRNRRTNSVAQNITSGVQSGATAIMDTSASMVSGHAYQVYSPGFGIWSQVRAGIIVRAQLTYTTNGSAPNTISTTLDMSQVATLSGGNVIAVNIGKIYVATANITFRCLLSAYLIGPSGGDYATHYGAADWPTDLVILDMSTDPGVNGTNY